MTILSFVAVFAGLGLVGSSNYRTAAGLVAGVFIGSALWWMLLSGGASLLRSRIGPNVMEWVNRGSGTLIFALGLYSLVDGLKSG
jgi:arginine exporter protein ArgO